MTWSLSRFFARSDDERHLDNRLLTALIRHAGWEFEPAQRVITALTAQRLAQPLHPAMVRTAIEDELRAQRSDGVPENAQLSWAVDAVEQALHRHGTGPS